jgi:hypothetical protein
MKPVFRAYAGGIPAPVSSVRLVKSVKSMTMETHNVLAIGHSQPPSETLAYL